MKEKDQLDQVKDTVVAVLHLVFFSSLSTVFYSPNIYRFLKQGNNFLLEMRPFPIS